MKIHQPYYYNFYEIQFANFQKFMVHYIKKFQLRFFLNPFSTILGHKFFIL